jgi:hypothetical protein
MASLLERSREHQKGLESAYADVLMHSGHLLSEEQIAIMALICEKIKPTEQWTIEYAKTVSTAQGLMPSGLIRSRQILVLLAHLADK